MPDLARPQIPQRRAEHLTKVGEFVAARVHESARPIVTSAELIAALNEAYRDGRGLYLRHDIPDHNDFRRLRQNLRDANVLMVDKDYGRRAFRVIDVSDVPAEDICCLVDEFIYISHLSAMQRYGLTDRRPDALHLSRPVAKVMREQIDAQWLKLQAESTSDPRPRWIGEKPAVVQHPVEVRGRKVQVCQTVRPGEWIQLRNGFARIATIGQTFLDTLNAPALCGGMGHALEVWQSAAAEHIEDIVAAVDHSASPVAKVRAGYILEEILQISDERVAAWTRFAQRGGSRVLDPAKPFAPRYSERWMVSINV